MSLRSWFVLIVVACLPVICYAQPGTGKDRTMSAADTDKVEIDIRPTWKGKSLKMGDQYYVNALGDTLYIDAFRIYLTNIGFTGQRNAVCTNSHLFDAEDTSTYSFIIKGVRPGIYSSIIFTVGVDSEKNVSGANDGDLDPVKGMYWAWNSGYIMAKLEGHSKVCPTLHHAFEFHIGGYQWPYNTARQETAKIPEYFPVGIHSLPTVSLNADVSVWLNNIDLSKVNSILTPGKEAFDMSVVYARMFSVESIFYTPLDPR